MSNTEKSLKTSINNLKAIQKNINHPLPPLPKFWRDCPNKWFALVEVQFKFADIKDEKLMYWYVLFSLDEDIIRWMNIDELNHAEAPYSEIKAILMSRFDRTQETQFKELLTKIQFKSDQKPSELLRKMEALRGEKIDDHMLRAAFRLRMPKNIRYVLEACSGSGEELAQLADRMMEVMSLEFTTVHQLDSTTCNRTDQAEHKGPATQFDLQLQSDNHSISSKGPSRISSQDWKPCQEGSHTCWYHTQFGEAAQKCSNLKTCKYGIMCFGAKNSQ